MMQMGNDQEIDVSPGIIIQSHEINFVRQRPPKQEEHNLKRRPKAPRIFPQDSQQCDEHDIPEEFEDEKEELTQVVKTPAQIIVHSNYEHLRNPSVLPLKVSSEEEEKRQKES